MAKTNLTSREEWQSNVGAAMETDSSLAPNIIHPFTVKDVKDPSNIRHIIGNMLLYLPVNDETVALAGRVEAAMARSQDGRTWIKQDEDPIIDSDFKIVDDPSVRELIESRDMSSPHQELVEAWGAVSKVFTGGVRVGIALGYIPPSVERRISGTLNKTRIRIADGAVIDTYGQITAYYESDRDEIGFRHDIKETGESLIENAVHELVHKIAGGTFLSPSEDDKEYKRSRVGYGTETRRGYSKTGLNEAVNHHVTMGIVSGDFETFDPDKRKYDDGSYREYRKIVATFIERSGGHISVKSITNGLFEDTGPDGGYESRRKFIQEVKEAYGYGAINKLEQLMELSDLVDPSQLSDLVLSRIQPPKFDKQGNIIQQGNIDTDKMPSFADLYLSSRQ